MIIQQRYFDLWDDMRIKGRWQLSGPFDEHGQLMDSWQFKDGKPLEFRAKPLFRLERQGFPLDFTLAGLTIPLVSAHVAGILERLDIQSEVQLIPAAVEDQNDIYYILNTLEIIKCIDDTRCEEVEYWTPDDGVPDRVGEYQKVRGLRVDPVKIGAANIFRPQGWTDALIISERFKVALEEDDITGPCFVEV